MIKAEIVADSKNEFGNRITTMVVTFPRIILAEFNTHRMFSRNSASSRAIPFAKMVKSVKENPFIPIAWQIDHKGMQGNRYITNPEAIKCLERKWLNGLDNTIADIEETRVMYGIDPQYLTDFDEEEDILITKQLCNRPLETYMYHTVIVTATEWENFFALRCPSYGGQFRSKKDYLKVWSTTFPLDALAWFRENKGQAEIHMMALAEAVWDAYNESIPKELKAGEWHIPYNDKIVALMKEDGAFESYLQDLHEHEIEGTDDEVWSTNHKVIVSSMMCARTSYTVVGEDQKPWTFDKYLENGDKLITAKPLHASPLEHCAKAMNSQEHYTSRGRSGNFIGFIQYRKMLLNENITL